MDNINYRIKTEFYGTEIFNKVSIPLEAIVGAMNENERYDALRPYRYIVEAITGSPWIVDDEFRSKGKMFLYKSYDFSRQYFLKKT